MESLDKRIAFGISGLLVAIAVVAVLALGAFSNTAHAHDIKPNGDRVKWMKKCRALGGIIEDDIVLFADGKTQNDVSCLLEAAVSISRLGERDGSLTLDEWAAAHSDK